MTAAAIVAAAACVIACAVLLLTAAGLRWLLAKAEVERARALRYHAQSFALVRGIHPAGYVLPKGVASVTSTTKREIRAGDSHGTR